MKKKRTSEKIFSLEAKDFYSDYSSEDMLFGSLVRSPAITGNVSNITIPELPEDYFFFTAKDIPEKNKIEINGTEIQIFADGPVSYNGEVLGIVIGSDQKKVEQLARDAEISFDINSLESAFQSVEKKYKHPAIDLGKSMKDLSRLVEELNDLPSLDTVQTTRKSTLYADSKTLASRVIRTGLYKSLSHEKAEEEIFSEDVLEFSGTWELKQADSLWQETSGAFCKMENNILHVCTATKWSFLLQDILCQALGLSEEKIIIHKTKTSGMFSNGIWKNAVLATQIALGSFLTGKPVKLVYTQEEQDKFMKPGIQTVISYKTGVTKDGILKSMDIDIDVNAGSQNPFAQEIIDRLLIASTGIYRPENLYINARAVTSRTPPTSIYPRIIDGQSFYALESHLQQITEELHLSPDDFRLMNLQEKKKTFPFSVLQTNPESAFSKVLTVSDFNRKFFSFQINATRRAQKQNESFFALPLRGIGFSCAYEGSGYFGKTIYSCDQKMEVTFNSSDDIEIHSIKPSPIVETIWKRAAADILETEPSNIKINSVFPADEIPNMPEETSSNISVMTFLLKKCCQDIQKKRFHDPVPIKVKKQLSPSQKNKWDNETFKGSPFFTTSFASCVVEIELDPYTYSEKIKGIWMVIDCGKLFDMKAAERTTKLAIQQELTTLVENQTVDYDSINIEFITSDNEPGQIGELVHNTLPAAFSSALSLALSTQINTLPASQSLLFELIKQREFENIQEQKIKEESENENTSDA